MVLYLTWEYFSLPVTIQVAIKDATFLQKFPWQCLIVDEGHRLKNSSSVLYKVLKEVDTLLLLLLSHIDVVLGASFL